MSLIGQLRSTGIVNAFPVDSTTNVALIIELDIFVITLDKSFRCPRFWGDNGETPVDMPHLKHNANEGKKVSRGAKASGGGGEMVSVGRFRHG